MNFVIITHVKHIREDEHFFAYAPYVREMNIWFKYVDEVTIIAPLLNSKKSTIDSAYQHNNINFNRVPEVVFTSLSKFIKSVFKLPIIIYTIFKVCKKADHIHLRCPGNMGLLGCLVQVLFPKKVKTAKYAGNWDPKAKQPMSYRFQRWLLSSTFFTKNITTLVYGNWPDQTKNIKTFFTASYTKQEIVTPKTRDYSETLKFVFVGSLVIGKRPLLAIKIVEALYKQGKKVHLDLYGDGILNEELQDYVITNKLEAIVNILGNQQKEVVKEVLKETHFLILPSKSEGWPKVIAEAMFFGAIPIATSVSCVPFMLDYGARGVLIEPNLELAVNTIKKQLQNLGNLKLMSEKASSWSQTYTLDAFETEIVKLLKP
ncbi:glycosyltransferase family 4 protein [Flavivirga jejuensis]|uniref:Glycosyltransferase family 4 protein n=1 Tax=Flavivirga jejuensis TaxID=870487 RepID=A0ABT8WUT9_9FLAO|nr:glycosyltransferase family 4 protein [Flavivirga jejuensis]MDO5976646.1 glycosyltransferase family 4 protein [Flavivirga jejuensis]